MAHTIKLKRTSTAGNKPDNTNITTGELALNTADKSLYLQTGTANTDIITLYDDGILHLDDTNNRVGIGTTSPTKFLHLNYNSSSTARTGDGLAGGAAGGGFLIQNTNGGNNTYANLDFRASTADGRIVYQYTGTQNQGDFHFITDNTNSPATAMTIKNDGKVGIGTTSPSYYFHVDAGNNNTTALFESDGVANVVVSGGNNRGSFVVQHSGTTTGAVIAKDGGGLEFGVGANYATNVGMTLDSSGNLSTGQVTSDDKFTVSTSDWYQFTPGTMSATVGSYGMGNANNPALRQLTFHVPNIAAYSNTGTVPSFGWYSNGADLLMKLESSSGNLTVKGNISTDSNSTLIATRKLAARDTNGLAIATSDGTERIAILNSGAVRFNNAFILPTAIGSAGQVLKVPTSGTTLYWADEASSTTQTSIADADGDTKIQVEESADEDKIRFDTAGTERVVIDSTGLAVTTAGVNGLILKQDTNTASNSARLFFEGSGGTVGLMNVANELSFRTGMTVASTSGTERFNIHTNAVTAQVQFRAVDGNASTPGISFATDTNTGIFRAGADTLSISTAGTERLRVSANGNVGIGTGTASVSTKLEVHGTTTLKSQLDFLSPDGTDTISASMLNTDTLSFTGDSGQLFSITDSSSGTIFSVNDISGVPSIEVEDDGTIRLAETFGNVGIGVETPSKKLEVSGDFAVTTSTSSNAAYIRNSGTGAALVVNQQGTGDILRVDDNSTTKFIVKDGGRVGIGTASPGYDLDVSGQIHSTAVYVDGYINHTGDSDTYIQYSTDTIILSAGAQKTYFKGDGRVGIGVEIPAEKLDVNGNVQADEFIGDLRGASLFKASAGEALSKGDVVYISGISGNTTVVSKADADDTAKMPAFGIAAAAASVNNPVEVYTSGILSGIDTSSYSEGDELFVSTTAGALTATAPTGESAALQKIGKVTRSHASSGSIFIIGAGRSNAVPNLNEGKLFVGNSSNQAVADNTMHVDIANSRVGIGTTSPSDPLHVVGTIRSEGSTTSKYLQVAGGNTGNFIDSYANDLYLRPNGTTGQALVVRQGGTTEVNSTLTVKPADIGGVTPPTLTAGQLTNAYQVGLSSSLHLSMKVTSSSGNFYWYPTSNTPIAILRQNGDFTLGSTNADNYVNTGSYFKPDTSGKFLAVTGSAHGGFLMLESSTVTDNDQVGGVFFTASAGQSDAHRQVAGIDAIVDAHSTNTALNGGDLRFFTKNVGSGLSDPRMTIRSSGQVGIGTTTPGVPLDVNGIIRAVAGDASTSAYSITSNGGDLVLKAGADDVVLRTGGSGSEGIYFQDGAQDTKMFINAENGQVGIGNTDPAETLHVSGIGKFTGTSESSAVLKLGQRDNASTTPLHTIYSSDSGSGRPLGGDALEINTGRYLQIIGATRTSAAGADVRSWKFTTATNGNETGTSLILYSQADASSSGSTTTVDRVSFSATSNQNSYINTAGNFGLGNSNPNRKLHLSGSGSTIAAKIEATDGSQASVDLKNSEGEFRIISDGGELSIYDQTDTAERLRIDTAGLVGIGTNNPLYNVDIHTTSGTGLNVTDDNDWATIRVDGGGGTDNVLELTNYGNTGSGSIIRTTGGGMLRFAAANTEAMRINANGNIGIGGSFSGASGKVCITESTANTASVFHTDGTSWLRVVPNLGTDGYNNLSVSGDIGLIFSIDNNATSDSSTQGLFIGPHTNSSNNGLKIQENGNIGIGTNSPSHKLHVVGDIAVNDNNKIILGGSGDLELYHNATDSYIINNTGHTYLRSDEDNKDVIIQARLGTGGNLAAYFIADSSDQGVKLYHGGSQKFATISNGIRVSSNNFGRIQISDNDNSGLDAFLDKSGINLNITSRFNTGHGGITLRRYNGTTTLTSFAVDEIGDSKFYRDNGSTIGAVFDASTGRFGVGTSAPSDRVHIYENANRVTYKVQNNQHSAKFEAWGAATAITTDASNGLFLRISDVNKVHLDANGNFGVGKDNPQAKFQVEEYGIETTTTTTSAATGTTIDTFAAATFRSARYSIQVTNTTDSTYHMTEILLIHTGTTANITEYGTIFTGTAVEATFDADINSGNVRLRATPATADSMTFKVVRHCITV